MSGSLKVNEKVFDEVFSGFIDIATVENLHKQFLNAVDLIEFDISNIDSLEFEEHEAEFSVNLESPSNFIRPSPNYNIENGKEKVLDLNKNVICVSRMNPSQSSIDNLTSAENSSSSQQCLSAAQEVKRNCKRRLDIKVMQETEDFEISNHSDEAFQSMSIQPRRRSKRIKEGLSKSKQVDRLGQKLTRKDEVANYVQPLKLSRCLLDNKNSGDVTKTDCFDNSMTKNRNVRLKLKLYKCFKCDNTFKKKSQYVTHLIKVHLNLLECSQCGHSFSHKEYLDQHIAKLHA